MKKIAAVIAFACAYVLGWWYLIPDNNVLGASNKVTYSPDVFPITDAIYDLGTTTKAWRTLTVNQICLTGDSCETSWPTGGSISLSPWATTTSSVAGQLNVYPLNTTDILNIGGTGTTTSRFWVDPNTSTAVLNGANTASVFSVGSLNNEWSLGTSDADKSFRIASSSNQIENVNAALTILKSGYIGIGTSSPYAKLSVAGDLVAGVINATSTTGTSTFAGGFTAAGGVGLTVLQNGKVGIGTIVPTTGFVSNVESVFTGITAQQTNQDGLMVWGGTNGGTVYARGNASGADDDLIVRWGDVLHLQPAFTSVDALTILKNYNVGIGTTSPYAKLSVAGPVVGQYFTATDTASYSTFAGRVGLGTTTPDSAMSINSYIGQSMLHLGDDSTNNGMPRLLIENRWTDYMGTSILVRRNASTPQFIVNGAGNSAFGTSTPWARLTVWGAGTTNATKNLELVNSASTTLMSVFNDGTAYFLGNVGIGTTSPYAKLSVAGQAVVGTLLASSTASPGIQAGDGTTGSIKIGDVTLSKTGGSYLNHGATGMMNVSGVGINTGSTNTTDELYILGNGSGQIMTVDPNGGTQGTGALFDIEESGNVGIGTTSPYAKLSVAGDIVAGVITATSSTSTFAGITTTGLAITGTGTTTAGNGINITSGCYAVNGVCLTSGGGGTWGSITGTLSSQTDLQNALDLKINNSTTTLPLIGSLTGLGNIGSSSATTTFVSGIVGPGNFTLQNTTGRLGVGTTSPAANLGVVGNIMSGSLTATSNLLIAPQNDASTTWPLLINFGSIQGSLQDGIVGYGTRLYGNAAGNVGYIGYTMALDNNSGNASSSIRLARTPSSVYVGLENITQSRDGVRWLNGASSPVEVMRLDASGKLGIGTTSPYARLSVAGDLVAGVMTATTSTSTFAGVTTTGLSVTGNGTSTFAYGINLGTGGCYAVNGVCLTSGSGTNYLTNSGSNTYLNTGTNLQAPTLEGTSTTATSTLYHLNGSYIAGFGLTSSCIGTTKKLTWADGTFRCETDQAGTGSQTPWLSSIDAGGYALTNAGAITGTYFTATSTTQASTFPYASSTAMTIGTIYNDEAIVSKILNYSPWVFDETYGAYQWYQDTLGYVFQLTQDDRGYFFKIPGGQNLLSLDPASSVVTLGLTNGFWKVGVGYDNPWSFGMNVNGEVTGTYFTSTSTTASQIAYASSTAQTITNLFTGTIAAGGTGSGVLGGTGMSGNIVTNVDDGNTTKVEFATRRAENTTASLGSKLFFGRQRGTLASPSVVTTGDNLYTINGYGYDGTDYAIATAITSSVENTPTANIIPGLLAFSTANTSGTLTEAMRIYPNQSVFIGTTSATTTRNTLTVDGDIYGTRQSAELNFGVVNSTSITADTNFMTGFTFDEDNAGALTATNIQGSGYYRYTPGATLGAAAATAGDGAIIGLGRSFMTLATSTPRTEFTLRALWPSGATTSVLYLVGLWNVDHNGDTVSTSTPGCGFVASSTPNWKAMCMTSGAAYTVLDTGLATTTTAAQFTRFRVESNGTTVYFYYNVPGGSETLAATISTNLPTAAQMLRPMASVGRPQATTAGTQAEIQLMRAYASWRQPQY